jgi:hypothetical protein
MDSDCLPDRVNLTKASTPGAERLHGAVHLGLETFTAIAGKLGVNVAVAPVTSTANARGVMAQRWQREPVDRVADDAHVRVQHLLRISPVLSPPTPSRPSTATVG